MINQDLKESILKALIDSGGSWSENRAGNHPASQAALGWLVQHKLVDAWGSDFKTSTFNITDKGRMFLKGMVVIE